MSVDKCPIRTYRPDKIGMWPCGGELETWGEGPDARIVCLSCGATWSDGKEPER